MGRRQEQIKRICASTLGAMVAFRTLGAYAANDIELSGMSVQSAGMGGAFIAFPRMPQQPRTIRRARPLSEPGWTWARR
jgi:hypothetical protein